MTGAETKVNLDAATIRSIEDETVERYSERLEEIGEDPRALGWDTEENQQTRFQAFTEAIDLDGRRVLDIGCGFGDFATFLDGQGVQMESYEGWDVNPDLLDVARNRHPNREFETRNVALTSPPPEPVADVGVMMGVLNFRLDTVANPDYAQHVIERAWPFVSEALLVDMLSTHRTPSYPKEDFVYYYDPGVMMDRVAHLTQDIFVKHDYPPIPQREFILGLKR